MKTMKPKTVLLCLMVLGCVPATGYADTLQEAIDEALLVPLAKLEAQANLTAEYETATEDRKAALDEYRAVLQEDEYKAKRKAAWEKYMAASAKEKALKDEIKALKFAARDAAIADAKAKARQGKKRARHCRATLKPVVELVEIVKCVQIVDVIADACSTATEQFRLNKKFQVAAKFDTLKAHVTQCVTANITGYSALVRYIVMPEAKDQYAGLIEKCRQEETNTLGVLGYQFIWPCFKGYLDMIDEPLEPEPTEISPEPTEDSDALPKVKA